MISMTSVSNLFLCEAGETLPYRRANFVRVDARAAPMKKSPSIKYWRNGGLFSLLDFLQQITNENVNK